MAQTKTISLREEFEERYELFVGEYEWTEPKELVSALQSAGEIVGHVFGDVAAARTMSACRTAIATPVGAPWPGSEGIEVDVNADWRDQWAAIEPDTDTTFPMLLEDVHQLYGFAYFGILPLWHDIVEPSSPAHQRFRCILERTQDLPFWVERVASEIEALHRIAPLASLSACIELCHAARARLKYDDGKPLSREELAALSRTSLKRLQNAIYSKTEGAPMLNRNGLIPAASARQWLADRSYLPSIWASVIELMPLMSDWGNIPHEIVEEPEIFDDYIFVPVAKDGTMFTPELASGRESKTFKIGPKGSEQAVASFDEALDLLAKMTKAYWRRPNENGNWGIVGAETWRRVRRSELPTN